MASVEAMETGDGPVVNLINKRIRALRKKYNRIAVMEDSIAQGKPINKEQEDVLRTKSGVCALMEELEKLRQPLLLAVNEEVAAAVQRHKQQEQQHSSPSEIGIVSISIPDADEKRNFSEESSGKSALDFSVEDLLNLLYFGSMFDVRPQNDYTSTMLTRTHERGSCLTYDYVTDDATDILGECDLDMLSMLSGMLISRPVDSTLSHKNALQRCVEHAKLWIEKSPMEIDPRSKITYADLRERLNKIMASDYFTTSPQIKTSVDVAAYSSFQAPLPLAIGSVIVPLQREGSLEQYQQSDFTPDSEAPEEETTPNELPTTHANEPSHKVYSDEVENGEVSDSQILTANETGRVEETNGAVGVEQQKQKQAGSRRSYQSQKGGVRGGRFGWRGGYNNGRVRNTRSGYQMDGRGQYYNNGGYYEQVQQQRQHGGNHNGRMYRERGGGRGAGQQHQQQQQFYHNHMAGGGV